MEIKEIIKGKGFKIKDFTNKLGVDRTNFYRTIKNPSESTLTRIAQVLDMTLDELKNEMCGEVKREISFSAIINYKGKAYTALSIDELKKIIKELE